MSKTIKVLHLSTHNEECGIATYQHNILNAMQEMTTIQNVYFPVSPNKLKLMRGAELDRTINQLHQQLLDFDILHIQHEYSFYNDDQLHRIMNRVRTTKKRVIFTVHTPPHAHRQGVPRSVPIRPRPRSLLHALRVRAADKAFVASYIQPLNMADVVVTTSRAAVASFAAYGVHENLMRTIELPVPKIDTQRSSSVLRERLHYQSGDVLLSMIGFISESKGVLAAVKALKFLAPNYKLAIIGGAHPSGQNDAFYDHVCDVIADWQLQDRVYITGFIADEAERDALARETDIALYPYDHKYYDYVSSAALTDAIANQLPIAAYPTKTFAEINEVVPVLNFAQAATYYELARTVESIDVTVSKQRSEEYSQAFSVKNQAEKFAQLYAELAG